jgi:sulfide:quinone oxidoreductase
VRDRADLVYLSNEPALGDFGIDGLVASHRGARTTSAEFIEAVFRDYGIAPETARLVQVDGRYGLACEDLRRDPDAWPAVYQNQSYPTIFAAGIAFAPPGPISRPQQTPSGRPVSPAPPAPAWCRASSAALWP